MKDAKFWIERGMVPPAMGYEPLHIGFWPMLLGYVIFGVTMLVSMAISAATLVLIGWGLWRVL